MANINLLPWREALRKERNTDFYILLGLIGVFALVLCLGWYIKNEDSLQSQRDRNSFLEAEVRKLDSKIKEIEALEKERQELIDRMNLIQDLQKSRPQVVHLFDEVVKTLPEGVNLSSIERKGGDLFLKGVAESGPRISNFMRNIASSEWLDKSDLSEIGSDKNSGANRKSFVLKVKVGSPATPELEKK